MGRRAQPVINGIRYFIKKKRERLKMSNMQKWALKELKEYEQRTGKSIAGVEEIMSAFSNQGHSGFSAGYALSFINTAIKEGKEAVEKRLQSLLDKNEDGMQQLITDNIREILNLFEKHNLGEEEAKLVSRLMNWKPINPLTGEDDEWGSVPSYEKDRNNQQNLRCSAVFRNNFDNSTAYYIDGKVFSDDGGKSWYTCRESRVPVTFPFEIPDQPERIILPDGSLDD
jgi:hemerythrin superfamily protein